MEKLDADLRREFPAFCVTSALSPREKSANGSSTPLAPDTLAAICTESTSQTCSAAHSENAVAASASKTQQPPSHSTTAPVPSCSTHKSAIAALFVSPPAMPSAAPSLPSACPNCVLPMSSAPAQILRDVPDPEKSP